MIRTFVPRERRQGERRVGATPETVKRLVGSGLEVVVESGAGSRSFFSDAEYRQAGAEISSDTATAWSAADLVLKVGPLAHNDDLGGHEAAAVKAGAVVIGLLAPDHNLDMVRTLASGQVTSLSMELVPRVTRAQGMDALSSQASIAGYKAVILAASRLKKYFPLLMTAAGTIPPARVVIMGAGVAGLQAIATAKRNGAVVEVSDIRDAVKEQVESLGGKFIELPMAEGGEGEGGYAREMTEDFLRKQREIVAERLTHADVVITTAQVPGRPAPRLVSSTMVEGMKSGAVIVDLAIAQGGNCELSVADEEVVHNDVLILAPLDLVSEMPADASTLYSRNVQALVLHMLDDEALTIDTDDEIVGPTLLTHAGEVVHTRTAEQLQEASS